jgi:hypothetical protein
MRRSVIRRRHLRCGPPATSIANAISASDTATAAAMGAKNISRGRPGARIVSAAFEPAGGRHGQSPDPVLAARTGIG